MYFEVLGPWVQPPRNAARSDPPMFLAGVAIFVSFMVVLAGAAALLVRRNLRLQRGDRRGALRLATFVFSTLTLANLFHADHTTALLPEFHLVYQILSQGVFVAAGIWLTHMALEPAVRRRWPNALISWSRLLVGRFLDPLVGRDVLVGVLASLVVSLELALASLAPAWFGRPPLAPGLNATTLSAPWHVAYYFFLSPPLALAHSLVALFLLYVLHAVVKRTWAARLLFFLALFVPAVSALREDPLVASVALGIYVAVWVALLVRFGLLSSSVFVFTFVVLENTPLTLDWSAWYAGRAYAVLAFFVALLLAAFYTSLGGKALFGKALLED